MRQERVDVVGSQDAYRCKADDFAGIATSFVRAVDQMTAQHQPRRSEELRERDLPGVTGAKVANPKLSHDDPLPCPEKCSCDCVTGSTK